MRLAWLSALLVITATAGCSAETPSSDPASDDSEVQSDATIKLTSDFKTEVVGRPTAGKGLRIEYALDRLPQCRGNVGGGGPGWNITGYYSENGGAAKTFEPTALTEDGKDRVSKPVTIALKQGGDLALWFEVTSRFGCHEYDSSFGNNYHVDVSGAPPDAEATITFGKDGAPKQDGALKAGSKVKIRYEQDRLPDCRRSQGGNPQWSIGGFAQIGGAEPQSFQTGRPDGSDREEIDAILELPRSGELALWFQVVSIGGCMKYDSNGGGNYKFRIE
jgi:hypothetical protein